jgi:N-acetylglucosaminyl-diphospho-decaprenol L-rhamnosyltransferase
MPVSSYHDSTYVNLPVIACIPNYNMASSLVELLPQIILQGYDAIYVVDDCSADNSREVVAKFNPKVTWIGGEKNLGSGGNRNRILAAHQSECIIHFLDADVQLESDNVPDKAQRALAAPGTAFVGGLVKNSDGSRMLWNYGPNADSCYFLVTAAVQIFFGSVQDNKPLWRKVIRTITSFSRQQWPDVVAPPERRAVFWPIEGNLLIRRSVLEKLGGFDASIREYDIIPPAINAYKMGYVSYFDPDIVVRHLAVKVRHYNRQFSLVKELYILIKHNGGWLQWILPEGKFKPRYNISYEKETGTN